MVLTLAFLGIVMVNFQNCGEVKFDELKRGNFASGGESFEDLPDIVTGPREDDAEAQLPNPDNQNFFICEKMKHELPIAAAVVAVESYKQGRGNIISQNVDSLIINQWQGDLLGQKINILQELTDFTGNAYIEANRLNPVHLFRGNLCLVTSDLAAVSNFRGNLHIKGDVQSVIDFEGNLTVEGNIRQLYNFRGKLKITGKILTQYNVELL